MKKSIISVAILSLGLFFTACDSSITIDKVDEGAYENVTNLNAFIRDFNSNKTTSTVELSGLEYNTGVSFGLSRAPQQGVDVKLSIDSDYVQTYNAIHETEFELYPLDNVSLSNDGEILVAPDEKLSYNLDLKITPSPLLEDGKTYILPIKATTPNANVNIVQSGEQCVYLIKNSASEIVTPKAEDDVKTFIFVEVNNTNPMNMMAYQTESGKMLFDYVVLFAANDNYDAVAGEVYIHCNPNVKFLLDNNEQFLQPLRKKGIKVILGLLGNHDAAGLAQLSDIGAKQLARKVKAMVDAYQLDGVNYDDEYSGSPDLSNPLFAYKSEAAAAKLMLECRRIMPDKHMSVFDWGSMYGSGTAECEGIDAVEYIDCVVANYGSAAYPVGDMTKLHCSGASTELQQWGGITESAAASVKTKGYGYYMLFAPFAGDYSASKWRGQVNSFKELSKGLYGEELKEPFVFYYKDDAKAVPMPF